MGKELSMLFAIPTYSETIKGPTLIGDSVVIEAINPDWIEQVRKECPKVKAWESLGFLPFLTHRLYVPLLSSDQAELKEKQQLIMRSILLSWIIKPTSIPIDGAWVISTSEGEAYSHKDDFYPNSQSFAYVTKDEGLNTLTDEDVSEMANYWDTFKLIHANFSKYKRLVMAQKMVIIARSTFVANGAHQLFHSALESLVYFGQINGTNKEQIKKRVPLILNSVTEQEMEEIYLLHNKLKHEAGGMSPNELLNHFKLQKIVRRILFKAISDINFADIICDYNLMKSNFGIQKVTRRGTIYY